EEQVAGPADERALDHRPDGHSYRHHEHEDEDAGAVLAKRPADHRVVSDPAVQLPDDVVVREIDRVRRVPDQHQEPWIRARAAELVARAREDQERIRDRPIADVVMAADEYLDAVE